MHPGLAADSRYKNYLIWLQERGIVWPVFRSPEAATVPGPGTDEEADPRRENPLPDTPPAAKGPDAGTAGPKIAIIRPTDIPAGAAELRRRMEGAMGLGDDAVLHLAPGNGDRSIYRTILSQGCQVVMLMGESAYRDFFPTGRPFDQCRGHPLRHGMLGVNYQLDA